MAHTYEDARQSDDAELPVSRFRPRYRALTDEELALADDVKAAFAAVEKQIERIKTGRYRSLAMTALEEACFWAIKELTG